MFTMGRSLVQRPLDFRVRFGRSLNLSGKTKRGGRRVPDALLSLVFVRDAATRNSLVVGCGPLRLTAASGRSFIFLCQLARSLNMATKSPGSRSSKFYRLVQVDSLSFQSIFQNWPAKSRPRRRRSNHEGQRELRGVWPACPGRFGELSNLSLQPANVLSVNVSLLDRGDA